MPKRLIEDLLPLGELNKYAQKGGGIGSLNAMHPYFARRPLTASRAMTLAALVAARGGELWPVAQAVVELLPKDNPERKALMSLLGTRLDLESRAQRWAETRRPAMVAEQLTLWQENGDG